MEKVVVSFSLKDSTYSVPHNMQFCVLASCETVKGHGNMIEGP